MNTTDSTIVYHTVKDTVDLS